MQTFLPYSDFVLSAKALDYRRLGKQRVEAKQLLSAIGGLGGWQKHPACDMWRNSIDALKYYHDVMIDEWMSRGYNNNMPKFGMADLHNKGLVIMPSWLGDPDFHASHRSNLLRKDPVFYGKHGWLEPNNLPYIWPKS